MLKGLLGAFLGLLLTTAVATGQTCTTPLLPNTLTNGTNADANAVMGNFGNLQACLSTAASPATTWTPQITFSGSTTGLSYSAYGYYTKIGRLVYVEMAVSVTNIGSASGTLYIPNLPFQATNGLTGMMSVPYYSGFTGGPSGATIVAGYVASNSTIAYLVYPLLTNTANAVQASNLTSGAQFYLGMLYISAN
jgi:hypothetical protein